MRQTGMRRVGRRLVVMGAALSAGWVMAQTVVTQPPPLTGQRPPDPTGLADFVVNKQAAIALGKALFWDANVGSDGKTACATCHFHAGADTRSKNVLSPGVNGVGLASLKGNLNAQITANDFPFHRPRTAAENDNGVQRQNSVTLSSPGVFKQNYVGLNLGSGAETVMNVADPVFNVGGVNVRQVEPRNTPTVINAGFNLRNFWDGRAQTIFNGVNNWGNRDPNARVYRLVSGVVQPVRVAINDASLASQAAGPPVSDLEMRAAGRPFADLGRKMLALRPLATQAVASDDSVLGTYRHASGVGIAMNSYADWVKAAFAPQWWSGTQTVPVNGRSYSQMEANFSLFWGLSLQLYQATLVSDQTPYDRFKMGTASALTAQQIMGLGVFMGKGKCANCHGGATFTNAAIRRVPLKTERMNNMVMGDGRMAVYDEGFYNIGVRRTTHDLGLGANDAWGRPLSFSGLAKSFGSAQFTALEADVPNVSVSSASRIAVNGAFKTPTLRNVALTAPYFHTGGALDLRSVVQFYNRGGNVPGENRTDLDADIQPLGLTETEIDALVAFMNALTDERVRVHAAPFDHPELRIPDGHVGNTQSVAVDPFGLAVDRTLHLGAVGRAGYTADRVPQTFEQRLVSPPFNPAEPVGLPLQTHHAGMCVDVQGASHADGARLVQNPCNGAPTQQWIEERVATGFLLRNKATGKCADAYGGGTADGTAVIQWACHGGDNQVFNWSGLRLAFRHSGRCLDVYGGGLAAGTSLIQWACHTGSNQRFTAGSMQRSGLHGGNGGSGFVDTVNPGQRLTSVVVRAGDVIDAIQGVTTVGALPRRGGTGGGQYTVSLAAGEHLVGVDGVEGTWNGLRVVGRLTFVTNTGRRIGPFGTLTSTTNQIGFTLRAPAGQQVVGFQGRNGMLLDSLGLLYSD